MPCHLLQRCQPSPTAQTTQAEKRLRTYMNELAGYNLGGYELEEEIGRGSMGVVYRGKQIALSREVAIKILPHSLAKDASYIARFIREAQIIAGLNHPNIVQIYDAGQQNRLLYFVMEFVQGPTLASLLLMDGIIPQHLAAEYGAQIADALDAAYRELLVIHRDIKPENLMLNRWGKIKVMDFGLARATGHRTITIAKSLVGSIYYSSPEQIRGQILDNRSDIFALGIVLYEMVCGRRPFNGRTMTELSQVIISGKVQPPGIYNPELSPQLESIILKALSSDREQRYEEAALMAQELRVLNLQPPAPPASPAVSLSLSGLASEPADTPPDLRDQVSIEGTDELMQQAPQQAVVPQQAMVPQQVAFSQPPAEIPMQDRQTVRDHIHRLFRLPARKTPPSATDTGKESATGT